MKLQPTHPEKSLDEVLDLSVRGLETISIQSIRNIVDWMPPFKLCESKYEGSILGNLLMCCDPNLANFGDQPNRNSIRLQFIELFKTVVEKNGNPSVEGWLKATSRVFDEINHFDGQIPLSGPILPFWLGLLPKGALSSGGVTTTSGKKHLKTILQDTTRHFQEFMPWLVEHGGVSPNSTVELEVQESYLDKLLPFFSRGQAKPRSYTLQHARSLELPVPILTGMYGTWGAVPKIIKLGADPLACKHGMTTLGLSSFFGFFGDPKYAIQALKNRDISDDKKSAFIKTFVEESFSATACGVGAHGETVIDDFFGVLGAYPKVASMTFYGGSLFDFVAKMRGQTCAHALSRLLQKNHPSPWRAEPLTEEKMLWLASGFPKDPSSDIDFGTHIPSSLQTLPSDALVSSTSWLAWYERYWQLQVEQKNHQRLIGPSYYVNEATLSFVGVQLSEEQKKALAVANQTLSSFQNKATQQLALPIQQFLHTFVGDVSPIKATFPSARALTLDSKNACLRVAVGGLLSSYAAEKIADPYERNGFTKAQNSLKSTLYDLVSEGARWHDLSAELERGQTPLGVFWQKSLADYGATLDSLREQLDVFSLRSTVQNELPASTPKKKRIL